MLLLTVFRTDNATKALEDSTHILSPSLWLAVYDPSLSIEEALEAGYTRLLLVNANGVAAINLGLRRRPGYDGPVYDYDLSVSSVPATDLPCNLGDPNGPARA